jgi:hypothetical protein
MMLKWEINRLYHHTAHQLNGWNVRKAHNALPVQQAEHLAGLGSAELGAELLDQVRFRCRRTR